jgi:hypothetical protein
MGKMQMVVEVISKNGKIGYQGLSYEVKKIPNKTLVWRRFNLIKYK